MSLTQTDPQDVDWSIELKKLVDTAKTPEERASSEAFAKALAPYLDQPELLRTLLGKIQSYEPASAVSLVAHREYASVEELKANLPDNVTVTNL